MTRIPIIPTIIVTAAAAVMIALGVWQLGRADEKAEMLAAYADARKQVQPAGFPTAGDGSGLWFRKSAVDCVAVLDIETVAGTSASGQKGWAQRATCALNGGDGRATALVDLGYSRSLQAPEWNGGEVTGIIAPGPRLVADPPLAGLQPLAKPDPGDLPNNHLAYAGQWFFFALTALIIYGFALRLRLRKTG